jgi:uncharacterized membrane protein YeaQ/YmgE (transglycosylase-associated protein family)
VGMVAWLVIGTGVGWLVVTRNERTSQSETVMAVACAVVGAILGGLVAGFVTEGQLDLEWQASGAIGAGLGALVALLWLCSFSR